MGVLRSGLLAGIRFYSRAISPALPPSCRFHPTCSAYAAEAIALHGAGRGTWLTVRRLLRCGPWHPGGVDFVPGAVSAPPDRPEAAGILHPPGPVSAPAASSADGARRPDPVTWPLATPSQRRRADEESSVA